MGDSSGVLVFDLWAAVPVFHRSGFSGRVDDRIVHEGAEHRYEHRTGCGRLVSWSEWRELKGKPWSDVLAESNIGNTWLRRDHAEVIGRPCARCYPLNTKC